MVVNKNKVKKLVALGILKASEAHFTIAGSGPPYGKTYRYRTCLPGEKPDVGVCWPTKDQYAPWRCPWEKEACHHKCVRVIKYNA